MQWQTETPKWNGLDIEKQPNSLHGDTFMNTMTDQNIILLWWTDREFNLGATMTKVKRNNVMYTQGKEMIIQSSNCL